MITEEHHTKFNRRSFGPWGTRLFFWLVPALVFLFLLLVAPHTGHPDFVRALAVGWPILLTIVSAWDQAVMTPHGPKGRGGTPTSRSGTRQRLARNLWRRSLRCRSATTPSRTIIVSSQSIAPHLFQDLLVEDPVNSENVLPHVGHGMVDQQLYNVLSGTAGGSASFEWEVRDSRKRVPTPRACGE
jgi:hypothetical protein